MNGADFNRERIEIVEWLNAVVDIEVPVLAPAATGTGEARLALPDELDDVVGATGFVSLVAVAFLDIDADGKLDLSTQQPSEPARVFVKEDANAALEHVSFVNKGLLQRGLYLTSVGIDSGASVSINELVGADGWTVDVPAEADPVPGT